MDPGASALSFRCSDPRLQGCFNWAKGQAMAYAHASDPVGPWYEAALPGREAFCMRDASHQAMGAHALGLQGHVLNMLRKFAANVSEPKDWCSYWEINRYDQPAPVDYRNDRDFWYNLPANFDVLSACYRMFVWSHDRTYLEDPTLVAFYRHTVTDYVTRWDLSLDKVAHRERFMHVSQGGGTFQGCRGIPSYHEGEPGRTRLGVDQLAFQAAAYRAYSHLLSLRGDVQDAKVFQARAAEVGRFIEDHFWDDANGRFNELLLTDGRYVPGGDMRVYILYNDAATSPDKIGKTVESLIGAGSVNIEMGSHYPEVLYRYGAHAQAYRKLLEISDPQTPRREYPEVSFAVVGAMVSGLMGIEPSETEGRIATLSRLTEPASWAELGHLPVHGNVIDVRHTGRLETVLTNRSGKAITWVSRFYGAGGRVEVDGRPTEARVGQDGDGEVLVWAEVIVAPGESKTARWLAP